MGFIIRGFIWDIPILIFAYVLFWGPNKTASSFFGRWGCQFTISRSGNPKGMLVYQKFRPQYEKKFNACKLKGSWSVWGYRGLAFSCITVALAVLPLLIDCSTDSRIRGAMAFQEECKTRSKKGATIMF